jgi:hypothetical protein
MTGAIITTEAPSIKRLAAAQVAGMLGGLLIYPLLLILSAAITYGFLAILYGVFPSLRANGSEPYNPVAFTIMILFPIGVSVALIQSAILKSWIKNSIAWVLGSAFFTMVLLWLTYKLWGILVLATTSTAEHQVIAQVVFNSSLWPLILIAIPIAYLGGVTCGAIQSRLFRGGKFKFVLASGISWSILFTLFIVVYSFWVKIPAN